MAATIVLCGSTTARPATVESPIYPAGVAAPGHTLSGLAGAWWNWYESLPDHELLDSGGEHACSARQTGDVWFLAGTPDSKPSHRSCRMPAGKTLFLPLVTIVSINPPRARDPSCGSLLEITTPMADSARDLFVSLDGRALDGVSAYRVATPRCFTFDRTGTLASTDGYWIAVKPLAKGHHELAFGGRFDHGRSELGQMHQDNHYAIDVE